MKIKGKLLVHKKLESSVVGESGFLSEESFMIYDRKLYINILLQYRERKYGTYIIPFTRVSDKVDGYEFDFSGVSISFPQYIQKPSEEFGWIGPFDVELVDFSWFEFYSKMTFEDLQLLWLDLLEQGMMEKADIVKDVKDKVFFNLYSTKSAKELLATIGEVTSSLKNLDGLRQDEDPDGIDLYYTYLISDAQESLYVLEKLVDDIRNADICTLSIDNLKFLLEEVVSGESQDYLKASKIRDCINLNESYAKKSKIIYDSKK